MVIVGVPQQHPFLILDAALELRLKSSGCVGGGTKSWGCESRFISSCTIARVAASQKASSTLIAVLAEVSKWGRAAPWLEARPIVPLPLAARMHHCSALVRGTRRSAAFSISSVKYIRIWYLARLNHTKNGVQYTFLRQTITARKEHGSWHSPCLLCFPTQQKGTIAPSYSILLQLDLENPPASDPNVPASRGRWYHTLKCRHRLPDRTQHQEIEIVLGQRCPKFARRMPYAHLCGAMWPQFPLIKSQLQLWPCIDLWIFQWSSDSSTMSFRPLWLKWRSEEIRAVWVIALVKSRF